MKLFMKLKIFQSVILFSHNGTQLNWLFFSWAFNTSWGFATYIKLNDFHCFNHIKFIVSHHKIFPTSIKNKNRNSWTVNEMLLLIPFSWNYLPTGAATMQQLQNVHLLNGIVISVLPAFSLLTEFVTKQLWWAASHNFGNSLRNVFISPFPSSEC